MAITRPTVRTTGGRVRGCEEDGVLIFKGIQFGEGTSEGRRFKRADPASWVGVRDATKFGPSSFQAVSSTGPRMLEMLGMQSMNHAESEECLFLNVWSPALRSGRLRPVLVYFHAAFNTGAGSLPLYNGTTLAKSCGIVVVTVNHRLGVLGNMFLGDLLGSDYGDSGNVSSWDLVLALQWVRDNIAAFGGDPNNVTIAGGCAGAAKVTNLMSSPAARGLYHKAFIQSRLGSNGIDCRASDRATRTFLENAGFELSLMRLREALADALKQWPVSQIVASHSRHRFPIQPTIDNRFLVNPLLAALSAGSAAGVPVIIGTARDDASFLATAGINWRDADMEVISRALLPYLGEDSEEIVDLFRKELPDASWKDIFIEILTGHIFEIPMIDMVAAQQEGEGGNIFMYRFDCRVPLIDSVPRAAHGMDIAFYLRNLHASSFASRDPRNWIVSNRWSEAFSQFMVSGVPVHENIPEWPACRDGYIGRMSISHTWHIEE